MSEQNTPTLRALLAEHLAFVPLGPTSNYCWFCEQDVNGSDGAKQEHLSTCLGQRTRAALAAAEAPAAEPLLGPVDLSQFLTAADSDNPTRALNTHGQTGTCLEHGSQLSSGKGHAGISPSASGQSDQGAERAAVRNQVRASLVAEVRREISQLKGDDRWGRGGYKRAIAAVLRLPSLATKETP